MFVHTLIKQAKEPQEEKVEDQEEGQVLSFVAEDTWAVTGQNGSR